MSRARGIADWLEQRGFPPTRLAPVPARLLLPIRTLWFALLILVVAGQTIGSWRMYIQASVIDQRFAAVGLVTSIPIETDGFVVGPDTEATRRAGVPEESHIVAVAGRAIPPGTSEERIAERLAEGTGPIAVTLRAPDGKLVTRTLERSERVRREAMGAIERVDFFWIQTAVGAVGAIFLLVAATMLMRRRPDDPVSLLLSFSFLCAAGWLERPGAFYDWIGASFLNNLIPTLWLGFLCAAIPAFPDGRFVTKWAAWLTLLAVPLTIWGGLDDSDGYEAIPIALVYLSAVAISPYLRFRRTPPGLLRQQLKWAAFGFASSLALMMVATFLFLIVVLQVLPNRLSDIALLAMVIAVYLCMIILPIGLLVSLMRYRLWDADAAIGRSIGYAAVTLFLASIWAGSTELFKQLLNTELGDSSAPIAAAVGTVLTAMVFGPARDKVKAWADEYFEPGLVRLRRLPQLLQIWQHGDRPEDIGDPVVTQIGDSLHARNVVLLLRVEDAYAPIAATGVSSPEIRAWLEQSPAGVLAADSFDRSDALFPVRIVLDEGGDATGALLLGPRSDGSIYPRHEREALATIEVPLAAALRQAQRRERSDKRLGAFLAQIEARIDAIEAATASDAGKRGAPGIAAE